MKGGGLFITGTDTGVGKTWATTRLLRLLRGRGIDAVGMKPVECGGRDDALAILAASGGARDDFDLDAVNPVAVAEPLAPAALANPPLIDFAALLGRRDRLSARHDVVLVEGAGGWLVPLDRDRTMADLAVVLGLPVLVVAANRLGVLNHVLLTVEAIASAGLECRAVFLNEIPGGEGDPSRRSNARVLGDWLPGIPVIERDPGLLLELHQG